MTRCFPPRAATRLALAIANHQSFIGAGFADASNTTFRISGPDLDRNRIQLGAGIDVLLSERSSLNVGYQAEFAGSDDQQSLAATFRMRW